MDTVRIECRCRVCGGLAARLDSRRAEGLTDTMIHNYVNAAHRMAAPFAARMGVMKEEK